MPSQRHSRNQRSSAQYLFSIETDMQSCSVPVYPRQSRSIAIKRSRTASAGKAFSSNDSVVDQSLYDLATWRMYNRIMTFRNNRPSRSRSSRSNTRQEAEDESLQSNEFVGLPIGSSQERPVSPLSNDSSFSDSERTDCYEEEAIFQLDL